MYLCADLQVCRQLILAVCLICRYFHMLPFLLLRTRLPLWLGVGILVCMELLWNLYPSSAISSGAILVLNFLITAAQWLLLAPAPEPKLKVLGKRPTRRR